MASIAKTSGFRTSSRITPIVISSDSEEENNGPHDVNVTKMSGDQTLETSSSSSASPPTRKRTMSAGSVKKRRQISSDDEEENAI